ncbi:MAG: LPP20 family lipoprotein [Treponema sp.]|jgi:hypothetical protein|nr:LPP20 family lipoprotein [Treponema sp.]
MKKRMFSFATVVGALAGAALLLSCVSAPPPEQAPSQPQGGPPPEVSQWIQQHQNDDDVYYGMGISEFQNESDALQQATMLARENLAGSLETEVAAIGENAVRRAEAQGETDRIARFQDATKQIVTQTLRKVKTFGPYMNGRGNTYVVTYLDKNSFKKDINEYVDAVFEKTDAELNQLLGL